MPSGFTQITTTFAILAFIADAIALLILLGALASRLSGRSRERWRALRLAWAPVTLRFAWLVSVVATLGSLYLSEIAHLTPCDLCWFQRICMYPEAVLLGIASFRNEASVARRYVIPLAAIGAVIAAYHTNLQAFPNQTDIAGCSQVAPCNIPPFEIFGFVTVPFMALAGFLCIIACLAFTPGEEAEDEEDEESPTATLA